MSQTTKPENRPTLAELKQFAAQLKRLCEQNRTDEALELVIQSQRRAGYYYAWHDQAKGNARCQYIHGRGYIPRPINQWSK